MLKHLLLGRYGLVPKRGRDEHGINGFSDRHSRDEWAAFERAITKGLGKFKKAPYLKP